jgi:hypothetical protein
MPSSTIGRLDPDVLLLAKPYRKQDLARMIRGLLNLPIHLQHPFWSRKDLKVLERLLQQ